MSKKRKPRIKKPKYVLRYRVRLGPEDKPNRMAWFVPLYRSPVPGFVLGHIEGEIEILHIHNQQLTVEAQENK